jgi:hypothetical protein
MSDIIYTPPVSSGGGTTINPTDIVIPVRLNATTFIDSNIENDPNNYLKTSVNPITGDYFGLFIDFGNAITSLGDINFNNSNKLIVDDDNSIIKTIGIGNDKGLKLDFGNNEYLFGDPINLNNGIQLLLQDSNSSLFLGSGKVDSSGFYYFYSGNGTNNNCQINIGVPADGIGFLFNNDSDTISNSFIHLTGRYLIDILSDNNGYIRLFAGGTYTNILQLDPASDKMSFTTNSLSFVGSGLQSNSAGGNSGRHLVITLNGNQYKIQLLNP